MSDEVNKFDVSNLQSFSEVIKSFNTMYKLPINDKPTLLPSAKLDHFIKILSEEVKEGSDILEKYQALENDLSHEHRVELLSEIADWLGDMVWYIQSESIKYGLDLEKTLDIIKGSNFSKLGADGKPIYDERGKVMKGPNYWRPEDKIKEMISSELNFNNE